MCKQCEKNPVYEFTNKRKLCKKCFIKWFEKKVFYVNRKFGLIKKGDVLVYKKENNFRGIVLEKILNLLSEKIDIEIAKIKTKNKKCKIVVEDTIDLTANKIVCEIIGGELKKFDEFKPIYGKIIKPLYLFLDKEVELYAKLKNLKYEKKKEKRDKISSFINNLEKKHPEIKRAVVNGYLKLDF